MFNALPVLDKLDVSGDEATGVDIVKKAAEEPLRWIAVNSGRDGSVIIEAVKKSATGIGYDAEDDEFGDMVKFGIIDPTKVARCALENAASVVGILLLRFATVSFAQIAQQIVSFG